MSLEFILCILKPELSDQFQVCNSLVKVTLETLFYNIKYDIKDVYSIRG